MKHKWLACVLTACMLLCMLPFAAQAADEAAQVVTSDGTTTYYADASKAIEAAPEGSTVTLLQDVGALTIDGKENITVDGNDYNVVSVAFGEKENNSDVTLKNANFNMTSANTINLNSNANDVGNVNITISDCTFTLGEVSTPWVAIYVQKLTSGLVIENNTFNINRKEANEFQCIGFAYTNDMRSYNAIITGNTMNAQACDGAAYFIIGSKDAQYNGNYTYGVSNLEVSNNTITYDENVTTSAQPWATYLANINGLNVTGNTFNNAFVGVGLVDMGGLSTTNVSITGNTGNAPYTAFIYGNEALTGTLETDAPADKINIYGGAATTVITVNFNANGGSCDVKTRLLVLTNGTAAIGELPTPTHYGNYSFGGWYTEDDQRVTENTTFSENTTITARWNYTGPVGFNIAVADTQHGTVTVDPTIADAGDTVTIKTKADTGYVVKSVTVTDTDGNKIDVTAAADGTYSFVMPRKSVKVAVTFAAGAAAMPFTDMDVNAYYYDAVCWAVMNDITNGVTDTTFGVDLSCTRAQMVTFLWRAAGCPEPATAENPFTDVKAGDYYYDAVLWAVEKGITKGVTDTTFCPNDTVSRAQTVTFLWRYDGAKTTAGNSFTDVDSDAYYADAVEWAVDNGVTTGASGTTFAPNADCTRAQIVTFLYRYAG